MEQCLLLDTLPVLSCCITYELALWMWTYRVWIITGLEYKFMVKSVDPDGTTAVTDNKNEEGMEEDEYGDWMEELTSPAPVILGEKGISPNHTGKNHAWAQSNPLAKPTDAWDIIISKLSSCPQNYFMDVITCSLWLHMCDTCWTWGLELC